MDITLLRHAQPEWVRDGLCVVNPRLSEDGFVQAEHLGGAFGTETFDEFLVSPLLRAQQTAAPLAARLGREPLVEDWLEECREPEWHGEPAHVAAEAYAAEQLLHPEHRWEGLPGGESMRDFTARIRGGVTSFLASRGVTRVESELPLWDIANPARRIVWVAHAGTNTVALSFLLGLPPVPWEWDRFRVGHASITRVVANRVGEHYAFNLERLSGVEHLPTELRTR